MSLPLTRRIAATALLVAASAAPLVGMAPAANAIGLSEAETLNQLSKLDPPSVRDSVDGVAMGTGIALNTTKDAALGSARPASTMTAPKGQAVSPVTERTAKTPDGKITDVLTKAAESVAGTAVPIDTNLGPSTLLA